MHYEQYDHRSTNGPAVLVHPYSQPRGHQHHTSPPFYPAGHGLAPPPPPPPAPHSGPVYYHLPPSSSHYSYPPSSHHHNTGPTPPFYSYDPFGSGPHHGPPLPQQASGSSRLSSAAGPPIGHGYSNGPQTAANQAQAPPLMSNASPGDQQPTYIGYVKSATDAILLLSACDLPSNANASVNGGSPDTRSMVTALPPPRRVTRRLLDSERAELVASGSVFVWDEKEAGMKRWTDGRVWSASRVSGCFLTYRELEARKKTTGSSLHDGPTSNQYKPEGLIKQSFSITTASGRKLHVISYFTKRDIREGRLRRISEDPRFVGEGGGEWGLQIDEAEYTFPDMHQQHQESQQSGSLQEGEGDGSHGDNSSSGSRSPSPALQRSIPAVRYQPPTPLPPHALHSPSTARHGVEVKASLSSPTSIPPSKKRQLPEDFCESSAQGVNGVSRSRDSETHPPTRPRLSRVRSSSMSATLGCASKPDSQGRSSFQSNTSIATSVSSGQHVPKAEMSIKTKYGHHSPTIPRESAIRGSYDMQPTQSQDCANAVGALLSLAGGDHKDKHDNKATNSTDEKVVKAEGDSKSANSPKSPSTPKTPAGGSSGSVGLGLSVKPGPNRRDLDRDTINMFSVRL